MDLAEVIYNLQRVPGFDECLTRMRDGDIEGTYFDKVTFRTAVAVVPQLDHWLSWNFSLDVGIMQGFSWS
jgi:hypothetical protein